ncbi:MAG: DUF3825 domain-containing protein [Bacilli bacterium]
MKSLFTDLSEFITLKTSVSKNHKKPNEIVIFHDYREVRKEDVKPTVIKKESVKATSVNTQTKVVAKEDQMKIYRILDKNLAIDAGGEFSMALISKLLIDNHIEYKKMGFSKMKTLMSSLPFLSLRDVVIKNVPQVMVSILPLEKKKKVVYSSYSKFSKDKPNINQPPKAKTELSFTKTEREITEKDINIPAKLILSLKENTGLGYNDSSFIDLIIEDLNSAIKTNAIVKKDDAMIFPLSLKTREGERLLASVKVAANNCDYHYYVNFIGTDKEKPKEALRNQIFFDDFDDSVKKLADIAKHESWGYCHSKDGFIILKIYLMYTFYRIDSQKKLKIDDQSGFASFNTGLVNENYEDIYCVLLKNTNPTIQETYIFQGFTVCGTQGLGKVIVEHFSPLPEKATYISKPDDIFFDYNKPIHTDYTHIITDNLSRFPIDFLKTVTLAFPNEKMILNQIIAEKNDFLKERLFKKLEDSLAKNGVLFNIVKACFDSAVDTALKMARYDFRSAIPSFFPTRNVMSLMLPLVFDYTKGPQAVLLVELTPSGNYQGQTILTLKQCYANARIIAPLENTFLNPKKIED